MTGFFEEVAKLDKILRVTNISADQAERFEHMAEREETRDGITFTVLFPKISKC